MPNPRFIDLLNQPQYGERARLLLSELGFREAMAKMKEELSVLEGYHETAVGFFLKQIDYRLLRGKKGNTRLRLKNLHRFYSQRLLNSEEASLVFVTPDLRPFPRPKLSVRSAKSRDAAQVENYLANLSSGDFARMHMDPAKLILGERFIREFEASLPFWNIWELEGVPFGAMVLDYPHRGAEGHVHHYIFSSKWRGRGFGEILFPRACLHLAKRFGLKVVYGQTAVINPFSNRMFQKLGIPVEKTYRTVPSPSCAECEVNRYVMPIEKLKALDEEFFPKFRFDLRLLPWSWAGGFT